MQVSGTLRENSSSKKNILEIKCVICNKFTKKKKNYDKYRLEVDSQGETFSKITKNQFDDVYSRILDNTDVQKLYSKDLYYHSKSIGNYVQKTERIDNSNDRSNSNEVKDLTHRGPEALDKIVASLASALHSGSGFKLSEVRDKVNEIAHPNQIYTARKTIFSISKCSEKMVFQKKVALEYDLSRIVKKDDNSVPRKYDLIL